MRRFLLILLAVALVLIGGAVSCVVIGYVRAGNVVSRLAEPASPLKAADLSDEQRRILLTVEDPAFERHHGVDLRTPGAGLTTLTQGLVKFLFFERFKPGLAKIPQTLIAIGFDAATPKDEQLRLFLNHAYLGTVGGNAVTGFGEGSVIYYKKPFRQLTREEFISLVAMTVAPNQLDPLRNPDANAERVRRIERLLSGQCAPRGLRDVMYEDCR
jgi:membrane carboxypeptidase/penicillin-binding protein